MSTIVHTLMHYYSSPTLAVRTPMLSQAALLVTCTISVCYINTYLVQQFCMQLTKAEASCNQVVSDSATYLHKINLFSEFIKHVAMSLSNIINHASVMCLSDHTQGNH